MNKRKRPDSTMPSQQLTEPEKKLYDLIKSRQDMGIWSRDMKQETNIPDNVVTKALKALMAKKLIKEVVHVKFKGRKHYMASEFEPSAEVTGGLWYNEGSLDTEFVDLLKYQCMTHISKRKVATLDNIVDDINKSNLFKDEFSTQQIGEILRTLVLDDDVFEIKSTGLGEFASIRVGVVCYRCAKQLGQAKTPRIAALASIPCGACPQIRYCTPDGIISPRTCEYYTAWLDW